MSEDATKEKSKQERPLVTFALFAYNQEKFIREAVKGALSQTYLPLEIIISDDCSTDNTYDIIEEVVGELGEGQTVILNRNPTNLGLAGHVNKVFGMAKGELVIMAAGDDISLGSRSAILADKWIELSRPCGISSAAILIDEEGRLFGSRKGGFPRSAKEKKGVKTFGIEEFIRNPEFCLHGGSAAWSMEGWKLFGPIPEDVVNEDSLLSLWACFIGRVSIIDVPLLFYRHHHSNIWMKGIHVESSYKDVLSRLRLDDFKAKSLTRLYHAMQAGVSIAVSRQFLSKRTGEVLHEVYIKLKEASQVRSDWWKSGLCFRIKKRDVLGSSLFESVLKLCGRRVYARWIVLRNKCISPRRCARNDRHENCVFVEDTTSRKFHVFSRSMNKFGVGVLQLPRVESVDQREFATIKSELVSILKKAIYLPLEENEIWHSSLVGIDKWQGKLVIPHASSRRYSLSKVEATEAAKAAGIAAPKSVVLRRPGEVVDLRVPADITYPCLLKWDNYRSGRGYEKGSNKVVHDRESLELILAELQPFVCGVMLQDLVPGQGVGAFLLRHHGKVVLRFAHRRVHESPWNGGVSAYCESSDDALVLEAAERLLEAIDYQGVAMVEFRQEVGKEPVFLEINGRLWGSLGLALAAGADFPRAMVECHLDGETTVRQPDLKRKVRWHDPGLEMDYLRSLWTKAPGPVDGPAPKWSGSCQVLRNFIDPRVKSDWWQWRDLKGTAKRYLKLAHREAAWAKAKIKKHRREAVVDPLVQSAFDRTRAWVAAKTRPANVLFLCYGNICRSPYAEFRWNAMREQHSQLPAASSSGFHANTERETPLRFQSVARHLGVELSGHRSKRLDQQQIEDAGVIFAMDLRNLRDLEAEFPQAVGKTLLLGALGDEPPVIPDPYGKSIGAGGIAYQRLDRELERLLAHIKFGE